MKKKDVVLIIGSISFLVLVIFLSLLLADRFQVRGCGCPRVVSHNFIWLFISLAVIFVGSLLYYLFSLKIDEKEKFIGKNMEIIYSIIDKDEKKVLDKIIKNNGKIKQSSISKDYDKIKAHRIIKKLQEKRIVEIIKEGKTNTIKLNKELKKELVK
jgi:DNA-binding transcriptional ArsR family regulator